MAADETDKYLSVLVDLVARRNITHRGLDTALGWKGGLARKVLRGERPLRLTQLLEILHVLKVEPLEYYARVHAAPLVLDRLLNAINAQGAPPPLVLPPHLGEEELSHLIRQAVEQALEKGKAEKA